MQEISFEEALDEILVKHTRFQRDAYLFVREALDYTQKAMAKGATAQVRHVTGEELLGGIREYAVQHFGPMATLVFEEWGVRNCRDFGEIVFNMVEHGLLAKTEQDSRADFENGYDFFEAFRKPFLPRSTVTKPTPEPKTTEV